MSDDKLHDPLVVGAREAWATAWLAHHWDFWVSLEWSRVNTVTAQTHLERFVTDLRRTSPGIHLLAGFHRNPFPHAHLALKLSRRLRARYLNAEEVRHWLRLFWQHGAVWVAPFDRARLEREHHAGGGALRYLARDPGSVIWG